MTFIKFIKLMKALSSEEKERLQLHLAPVIKARQSYMYFVGVKIPADKAKLKRIEAKRQPLLQSDDDEDRAVLAELNRKLQDIRKKIEHHTDKRVMLKNAFVKAKESFARGY